MKGTILKCIEELVKKRFGAEKWPLILKKSGQSESLFVMTSGDYPDAQIVAIMQGASEVLGVTMDQVFEAFGDYWSTVYAPDVYQIYFKKASNAKEFLLALDQVHVNMTKSVPGAHPPRFTYEQKSDKYLVMKYNSARGLVVLMPALVRGVAKKFGEKVDVSVQGSDVHIKFA